ncbi:serine/threonine-protein phosphatase PP-Z [Sphaceloma murrayae]|uniref:Serine/threonine-protein phosphatase PP-Z n=1 Tax=Sphaceloma murrayae TaxID=2082308 RepID=A0A2K1R2D5_9PEZI|nr:serine/threonine-protein phosphatase PP-Z [Sphaceloma murrayae]
MSTPSSPLLNVEELPQWVKQRARHVGALGSGRLRFMAIASMCILLGYFLTSNLNNPPDASDYALDNILSGDSDYSSPQANPAPLAHRPHPKKPSIKGALSDLTLAVSGHLTSLSSSLLPNRTYTGIFTSDTYNLSSPPVLNETITTPANPLNARLRIGKTTIIFGGAAIYERAVRTHELHDRMQGYPLHVLRHGILDDVWSKPGYILSVLLRELSRPESERLQWLLWVDADTILLNPHVPIETFLPPSPEFDDVNALLTRDWNGLNNGVFPLRVCQWSVDLFAAIVSFRFYRPDAPLVFRDQSAMEALLREDRFARHVVWAPQRWFNAYQGEHNETLAPFQVRRGDFLVHFAGVGDREQRMLYWLERAEEHLPDWEIEVQHTSYPGEAKEFWRAERESRAERARMLAEVRQKAVELWGKTEGELGEYAMRLQESESGMIREKVEALKGLVNAAEPVMGKIEEGIAVLNQARASLDAITNESNKGLLKEAHDAIFSSEKIILHAVDRSSTEIQKLEDRLGRLKHLVLQPSWLKADMTLAIDEVRKVKTALEPPAEAAPSAHTDAEQAARLAAIEKQKYEAELAKAELLGIETQPTPPPGAVEEGAPMHTVEVMVTHTNTAIEMSTHWLVVMETATIELDERRR